MVHYEHNSGQCEGREVGDKHHETPFQNVPSGFSNLIERAVANSLASFKYCSLSSSDMELLTF